MNSSIGRVLAMAVVLSSSTALGCLGAVDDSTEDSTDESALDEEEVDETTEAAAAASGSLAGCVFTAFHPVGRHIWEGGADKWVTHAMIRISCPSPRRTAIKGRIKEDKAFEPDDVLIERTSKVKIAKVHDFLVRWPHCKKGKFFTQAWAFGISGGKVVDQIKDESQHAFVHCND